ncbi:hypothetical protein [Leptospira sp. GIMC2001]|uniref:hypothetical protein n=1 Tax=Leptospira sp. GIMC2001 TaxID=1513297 RepID=UPI002349B263|nr:hypothetical protein [Leptospira sp. GIMC2001]WCL47860.1 hypothetical protein O4O04_11035 [Leptospira sp. GIMC2001]
MNYVRPCPSCNVELRIPLIEGDLLIRCPRCGFGFEITPSVDATSFPQRKILNQDRFKKYFQDTSNSWLEKSKIKKFIEFSLYFILILYIVKNCNLAIEKQPNPISIEEREQSLPKEKSSDEDDLAPEDSKDNPAKPAPYSI